MDAADEFALVPVDRSDPRPIVGIVGEIFLRHNAYGNDDLVRQVEAAGGEVRLAGVAEFFQMAYWLYLRQMAGRRHARAWVGAWITQWVQDRIERRLHSRVAPALRQPEDTSVRRLLQQLPPLYPPRLGTEAVLSLSKPADLMAMGASGILNVLPFSCMPGIITHAMAPVVRRSLRGIPWLDVVYRRSGCRAAPVPTPAGSVHERGLTGSSVLLAARSWDRRSTGCRGRCGEDVPNLPIVGVRRMNGDLGARGGPKSPSVQIGTR